MRCTSLGGGSTHFGVYQFVEKCLYLGSEISLTVRHRTRSSGGGRGFLSLPRWMRPLQPLHLDIFPCTKYNTNGSPTAGLVGGRNEKQRMARELCRVLIFSSSNR